MKKWKQKAIIQKFISYLPYAHKINYFFQKYVTKGVNLSDAYFYDRLSHARGHIKSYQLNSNKVIPAQCLELGTGWYPVVPISLFLLGADKIYSVDISTLTSKKYIKTTLLKFVESNNKGLLKNYVSYSDNRFEALLLLLTEFDELSFDAILQRLNISYLIEDARKLSLKDSTIDLVHSNNTFEHIYPDVLIPILEEFKRVVEKQDGVMSHFIDMSDHFSHFDTSITNYNFLQFSDRQWKRIDNSIQPQSRLRIYDYRMIYDKLDIPITSESCRVGNVGEVKSISLASKFEGMPIDEIAKCHCHITSKMGHTNVN